MADIESRDGSTAAKVNLYGRLGREIERQYAKMSKGQKAVADYVRAPQSDISRFTAAQLAEKTGVSASTVVRFACLLGCSGYPEFQRELAAELKNSLTASERFKLAVSGSKETDHFLSESLTATAEALRRLAMHLDAMRIDAAAQLIVSAERVFILGLRAAGSLAAFLDYYLKQVLPDVHLLESGSTAEISERLLTLRKSDLLLAISFPRYSQRSLSALRQARQQGAETLAITDTEESPLAEAAEHCLTVPSGMLANVDNLTLPFALVTALAASATILGSERSAASLEKLEKIWQVERVYINNTFGKGDTADDGSEGVY